MTASIDQTVHVTEGPEYTYPRTITETTGKDISTDTVRLSLGTWDAPGTWVAPTVDTAQTDHATRVVQLLLDNTTPAGDYWLWVKVTDSPETPVRRTDGRITIINPT